MLIDLKELSTPQLRELKRILAVGVAAQAETAQERSFLCHKSPPKGYPKEKSDYGDSECYRYPLNTKARCLSAWRYVHHANNKSILGKKFGSIETKIKNYAKEHYGLDLEAGGESEDLTQAFFDYYDAETMGERCDCVVLEEENKMEDEKIKVLESEKTTLISERDALVTEKTALASQVDALTKELNEQKVELEALRQFKLATEQAAELAKKLNDIKTKLVESGIEANLDDEKEAKYWLDMSEDNFKLTVSKMVELKKGAKASASMKVPNLSNTDPDATEVVRLGLKKMREGK